MMNDPHSIRHSIDAYFADMDAHTSLQSKILAQTRGEVKVKKKLSAAFALLMILVLATITALAAMTLFSFDVNKNGKETSGITFAADDVYFDGYLLIVPITMTPNDPGVTVYEDVLGDYENEGDFQDGLKPLGAYCDVALYDADGTAGGKPYERVRRAHRLSIQKDIRLSFPSGQYSGRITCQGDMRCYGSAGADG